jgi:hypothetical protein
MSYNSAGRGPIRRAEVRDYDDPYFTVKEIGMSMQSEGKDAKGRNYDQVTKDGSSSAGTMGTGGTGDIGRVSGDADTGSAQSDARTDDLLSAGTDEERRQGYRPSEPGAVETGLEGVGNKVGGNPGNRQSNKDGQQ